VDNNTTSINQQTDKMLSYGHSNGWFESKAEMIKNLETGYMDYLSFKEDSLQVWMNGDMANARFMATIGLKMNGKENEYRLKVLEVWVRKGKRWILFSRQAVKG
ncbi:MAG: nuclear transport factor 2 family protein, partial [Pedobacter sp.]